MSNITFETFVDTVNKIYKLYKNTEQFYNNLHNVAPTIEEMLVELPPVNNLYLIQDKLMIALFGEEMVDIVYWLFYEFQENENNILRYETESYTINNLEDFYNTVQSIYYK